MSPQLLRLLSVAAVYGVLVMVFQWGWGISIPGSEEAWLPLFLFRILFGLPMDYHMLLLNRIKEFHNRGASNEESAPQNIKITADQITSAAAIMVGGLWRICYEPRITAATVRSWSWHRGID